MSKELWDRYFSILESGLDLEPADVAWCMNQILEGKADNELIKKFLLSLKAKGETSEEVGALVAQMYEHSAPISITERAVDTVGTGGDGAHTINISTTAAIIAAAAGAKVVKHGNRAASSKSGAADLLEALGVAVTLDGKGVEATFSQLGIGFCFAPVFHPAMRFAAPARKELGVPTVFNILGPLSNPAKPKAAAIGVANDRMHLVMAQVLADKGVDGFVFRGDDKTRAERLHALQKPFHVSMWQTRDPPISGRDGGDWGSPATRLCQSLRAANRRGFPVIAGVWTGSHRGWK